MTDPGAIIVLVAIVLLAPVVCAETPGAAYTALVKSDPDLVAYWRMEGNLRDAKDALTGKSYGGSVAYVKGPVGGRAVALGKGCFIGFGPALRLDLTTATLELFFQISSLPGETYNPCLIAKRHSSPETRFSVHVMRDLKNVALWNGQTVALIEPPDGPLRPGRWYHLAVTSSPKETRAILDGVPCAMSVTGYLCNLRAKGLPFWIGASAADGAEQLECAVDEVAVYARVLSGEEIARHVDAAGWAAHRAETMQAKQQQDEERKRMEEEKRRVNRERIARRLEDPRLSAVGETRLYDGEHLAAISLPVGGIGAGQVHFNGNAEPYAWQIFNNFAMAKIPRTFFAVRVLVEGGEPVVRALQTVPAGPFPGMEKLRFRGEYPFGWYDFTDPAIPVRLTMEVFNPLIPFNARDSAMPCFLVNFMAENTGAAPVQISVLAAQQNAVGFTGEGTINERSHERYGGNVNRILYEKGTAILHLTADRATDASGYGDMALAVLSAEAKGRAAWDDWTALFTEFQSTGLVGASEQAGPSPERQTLDGALAAPAGAAALKPGQKKTVTFVLAWRFPNVVHGSKDAGWVHEGNMYAGWWNTALDVVREARDRFGELTRLTRLYHDTLYGSNLPRWLLDRITSQVAILRSPTCFWAKDGYFGGWEGCNPAAGCCHGNCGHVWHYAQAHARLFPAIARQMREQALGAMEPNGAIPFRQPKNGVACDAQCGEVLETYREHLLSADGAWLHMQWPAARKSMDYAIATWDANEDGVLAGVQHNTLDCNLGGSTSWLGSMYLAALEAAAKMADLEGDAAAAQRFRRIRESGGRKQDETLFNGEYYIQIPDPEPLSDYNNGCHIDQVLGQWWAHQLDLGWIYPREHVRSALRALLRHNFRDDFRGVVQAPRKFVDDADAGMQMIQWPNGDRPAPHTLYADEVMTGFEYSAAAAMVQADLLNEGLMVALAASDRYDGRLRTGLSGPDFAAWCYSGNPFGDDECGKFYARAMSVWSMLLACQGFVYDAPAKRIGFKPIWKPADHVSFFTASAGYGLFAQTREKGRQSDRLRLAYGTLEVSDLVFGLPANAAVVKLIARHDGKPVATQWNTSGDELSVRLGHPVVLRAGQSLEILAQLRE